MSIIGHKLAIGFMFLLVSGCMLEKCDVLIVVGKSKCTFDREFGTRVCVAKLGKAKKNAIESIRGRTVSTYLPEPLALNITEVEMCIRGGKRIFNKL